MMLYITLFMCVFSPLAYADVFSKPTTDEQVSLEKNLNNDIKNFYYRGGMDFNINDSTSGSYDLNKDSVTLGCNRFDSKKSEQNYVIEQIHSSDISSLVNQLTNTPFLLLEYSSPTMADLLKHFDTMAHLQLSMRYRQCEDLERVVDDPVVHLRKQAQMDCLKRGGQEEDMNAAFEGCFEKSHDNKQEKAFQELESPDNANYLIPSRIRDEHGPVDVTDKTIERVNQEKQDLADIKAIIPHISITLDSVHFHSPSQRIRQVVVQNRQAFLKFLQTTVSDYKEGRDISGGLNQLSVAGVPLSVAQVKNIAMLDDTTTYLAMNKMASQLAYLKTVDLYSKALEYLRRVLNHPAIEPGYKRLMQEDYDFIAYEMDMLKGEKDRLAEYFGFMGTILDEADAKRLKTIAMIKDESASEEKKGFFNLNP